jgi:hypothetical protein
VNAIVVERTALRLAIPALPYSVTDLRFYRVCATDSTNCIHLYGIVPSD